MPPLPHFSQLVDISRLQQQLEALHGIIGISISILDGEGQVLVSVGWQELCTLYHRAHPESAARCRESDAQITSRMRSLEEDFLEYRCGNGLWELAMPITIDREQVATFFISQFFYDDDRPDTEHFRAQARECGFDEQEYLRCVAMVPLVSRESVRRIVAFSRNLIQLMAEQGLNNLRLSREVEERKKAEEEASFFRTLVEYTRDPIYVTSPADDYRMAYVNQAACSHFGRTREELLTMRIPDWDPVFDMEKVDALLERMQQGESLRFETLHRTASGELIPVEVTGNYLVYRGQELILGHFHNITRRKQAEEQILRLNRLYAVLSETNKAISHSADRSSLFDRICRVIVRKGGFRLAWIGIVDKDAGEVNSAAWYGRDAGCPAELRIPLDGEAQAMGAIASTIRAGGVRILNDFLGEPASGPWHREAERQGYRSVALISLQLRGRGIGVLVIYGDGEFLFDGMEGLLSQLATDISFALDNLDRESRRRAAEQALREETLQRLKTTEELYEKERLLVLQSRQAAMGEMVENIAHQWRQPLNNLGLMLQDMPACLAAGEFNEEYLDETVERAMEQILHMSRTIDDFKDFFRPDRKKQTFSVRREIARTLSLVAGSFGNPHISVETAILDDAQVCGYPNEYAQVLLNILLNARDAFAERRVSAPRIRIRVESQQGRSIVTISDNAGGIPMGIIHRIFEPYVTTKGPEKGTGVGLFMSKTIIEKHMNGFLSVRNTEEGAEFRIEV